MYTVQFDDETTEDKRCNQLKIYFPCDCNIVEDSSALYP